MAGRPPFKPTSAQRDTVKLLKADGWSNERIARQLGIDPKTLLKAFPEEIEFGADAKQIQLLEWTQRAAKKGNASAIKQLSDRFAVARAARQLEERAGLPAGPEETKPAPKLGKKEQQQAAAESVTGKFAPPPPPKLH